MKKHYKLYEEIDKIISLICSNLDKINQVEKKLLLKELNNYLVKSKQKNQMSLLTKISFIYIRISVYMD